MSHQLDPKKLDVKAFARDAGGLSGDESLIRFERLAADALGLAGDFRVHWEARGELKSGPGGTPEVWLHMQAHTILPMVCQRCCTSGSFKTSAMSALIFLMIAGGVPAGAMKPNQES